MLKTTKSDDTLPRLYAKPPLSSDIKRRGLSPLVHDTKSYTNGSTFKRDNNSDGEDDFMRQQKLKVILILIIYELKICSFRRQVDLIVRLIQQIDLL
jgi:hypothetical protein